MDYIKVTKASSNKTRLNILMWLKDPQLNFGEFGWKPHNEEEEFKNYVCIGQIHKKSGQSQSTFSEHLSILEKAGLLKTIKLSQWTLFARNEKAIEEFKEYIKTEL